MSPRESQPRPLPDQAPDREPDFAATDASGADSQDGHSQDSHARESDSDSPSGRRSRGRSDETDASPDAGASAEARAPRSSPRRRAPGRRDDAEPTPSEGGERKPRPETGGVDGERLTRRERRSRRRRYRDEEFNDEADDAEPRHLSSRSLEDLLDDDQGAPPRIVPRSEHPISRQNIADTALRVLQRLNAHGFRAFLVGGAVRDLYIGKEPKDYDIATDARPSRIKRIFRNCRIIGRRFRIAHVFFPDGQVIELATFRRSPGDDETARGIVLGEGGMIVRDNEYGSPSEDARRRDLTINGLFYDLRTFSIIDYVGGVADLDRRVIRMINEPDHSFREDPVRMVRALRHAARTGFEIEPETLEAIYRRREEVTAANPSRLLEEILKDLRSGYSRPQMALMMETHVLDSLLPSLAAQLREHGPDHPLWERLEALDQASREGATFSTPLYLAVLFHTIAFDEPEQWRGGDRSPPDAWRYATRNFREAIENLRVSRRDTERFLQILTAYRKLTRSLTQGRLANGLLGKVYLPEALQFLAIDAEGRGLDMQPIRDWILKAASYEGETQPLEADEMSPDAGERSEGEPGTRKRRGRRGGRRRRRHKD